MAVSSLSYHYKEMCLNARHAALHKYDLNGCIKQIQSDIVEAAIIMWHFLFWRKKLAFD